MIIYNYNIIFINMNVYNLTRDDVFDIDKGNSTKNIDFNIDSDNGFAIYDSNNYDNVRPIFKEFMEDYSIEPNRDDFNREIELQKIREQNERMKNYGEISSTSDPRITKYEDTYSITPYATYMITPLSQMDGDDIVSRFDRCYGEWKNLRGERCHKDKPCKRVEQEYIIRNPEYTGEHCRDKEGRRLRDGDTRNVFCNHYMNKSERCSGHGKCVKNSGSNTCTCDDGYSGPNCDPCFNVNCLNGGTCNNGKCTCDDGYIGPYCKFKKSDKDFNPTCYAGFIEHDITKQYPDVCNKINDKNTCDNAYYNQYNNNLGKPCIWEGKICHAGGPDLWYDTTNFTKTNCDYSCNDNNDCDANYTCNSGPGLKCCTKENTPLIVCNPNARPTELCPGGKSCPQCNSNICCCPPIK